MRSLTLVGLAGVVACGWLTGCAATSGTTTIHARTVTPAAVSLATVGEPGWLPPNAHRIEKVQNGPVVQIAYSLPGAANGAQNIPVPGATEPIGPTALSYATSPTSQGSFAPPTDKDSVVASAYLSITDTTVLGQPARLIQPKSGYGMVQLTWLANGRQHVLSVLHIATAQGITGVDAPTLMRVAGSVPAGQ